MCYIRTCVLGARSGSVQDSIIYLLTLCIDLREESRLLVLKKHAQGSAHVEVHNSQESYGGCPNGRVGGSQSSLHIVDESLNVDARENKGLRLTGRCRVQ